jgi:hypothetical protein
MYNDEYLDAAYNAQSVSYPVASAPPDPRSAAIVGKVFLYILATIAIIFLVWLLFFKIEWSRD